MEETKMKICKYLILTITLVFFGFQSQGPAERLIQKNIPAPSLVNNLFDTPTEQPVLIYLPPSYHTSKKRYPVIYFLPGFTTNITEMIDGTFQGLNIQKAMDDLVAAGIIQEMIFVEANGRNFLGGSFYVNSHVTGNWEDFIVKDVVQFIDENYRTLNNADSRGIAGSSMGGYGAINIGMRYPDVFSTVYSLSPGLFDEEGLKNQGMFGSDEIITRYLEKQEIFDDLPESEARETFKKFIEELYNSRTIPNYFWAFSYAYGAAFSPDINKSVPYIDYPYALSDNGLLLDQDVLKKYIGGFGGLKEKVYLYRDNLRKLKGLTIDIGANDYYKWIVHGSRYFAQLLQEARIPYILVEHAGGHEDRLRERIENHLLPYFSQLLKTG